MGESITDEAVKEGVNTALEVRKIARTRRTQVGIAYQTPHGWLPQTAGVNTQPDVFLGGLHAEQLGIIGGYALGLRTTDFIRMIEVYFDPTLNVQQAFPACPECWASQVPFTHKGLEIIVARVDGSTVGSWKLKGNIFNLTPPGEIYPSDELMAANPLSNFTPLGNKPLLDPTGQMRHRNDSDTVLEVALRHKESVVGLVPRAVQKVCDSVSIGMADGRVFGGFPIQSKLYTGWNPEDVATVQGLSERYNKADFEVLGAVVPKWVPEKHTIGFLGMSLEFRATLLEWGNPDPAAWRVVAADSDGNRRYDGSIASILRSSEKIADFNKFFETQRTRLASEPRVRAKSLA